MCNVWDMHPSGFNSWACFSGTGPTDLQTISKMPWSVVSRTGWCRSVEDQWWWPQIGGGSDWSSMMLRNFRNVITDSSWIMDPIKRRIKYPEFSCFFQIFLSVFWNMIWLGGPFIIWQTSHTLEKPCIWFIKLVKRWSSQIWTPYMKNLKIIVKRIHRFQGPVSFRFYLLYATLHIWRFTHDCHLTFQVDALWNHSPTIDITM